MDSIINDKPQTHLRGNTSYDVQIVKISPPFLHSSPFYPPPNGTLCNSFQSARDPQNAPFRGASASHLHGSLELPESASQTASADGREFPYFVVRRHFSPQTFPFAFGPRSPCNTWFLWAHPSQHPERHHDRFSRFARRSHGRDRQTTLLRS